MPHRHPRLALVPALAAFATCAALAGEGRAHEDHTHDDHAHEDHTHEDHTHDEHAREDHADDDHAHDDHAHVHGQAQLGIRLDGFLLETALTVPGGDLFPEDAPHGEAAAAERLPGPGAPFAVAEAAGCTLATNAVEHHEIAEGAHAGHADYTLRFGQICADPDAIAAIEVTLFETLPDLEGVALTFEGEGFTLEAAIGPGTGAISVRPFAAAPVN